MQQGIGSTWLEQSLNSKKLVISLWQIQHGRNLESQEKPQK